VVFVGFASKGTLARQIIDGRKSVRIFDEDIPVRAKIHTIGGFSAHADQAQLLAWQRHTGAARTFLTHGEEEAMAQFAKCLPNTSVEMPSLHQSFEI
jgi:metallo-beta-lactamase family protein